MIQNTLKILGVILLGILQLTLMPFLGLDGVWPNLLLIFALVLMILDFDWESVLIASLGGLILDLASPVFFGFHIICLLSVVALAKFVMIKFLTDPNLLMIGSMIGVFAFINDFFVMIVGRNFMLIPAIINAAYSAVIGLILYHFFQHWFKKSIINIEIR